MEESHYGQVAYMLDCDIIVSSNSDHVRFTWKMYESPDSPSYGLRVQFLCHTDALDIK